MKAIEYVAKASELFVLSDSFTRIKELIDDKASTMDDIAEVIILDPALSVSILKLANSSLYNYSGKIDTVSKAVLVLGITEVYSLVIAHATKEAFKNVTASEEYLERFWLQTIDCALLLKFLAGHCQQKNGERLFILGLLHNLGELVVNQFSPDKVENCTDESNTDFPWQKQHSVFGFTFTTCSTELLKQWQLPYNLIQPISLQDDDDFANNDGDGKLLYIAKRLMLHTNLYQNNALSLLLSEDIINEYALDHEFIEEASLYCEMERLNMLALLKPSAVVVY